MLIRRDLYNVTCMYIIQFRRLGATNKVVTSFPVMVASKSGVVPFLHFCTQERHLKGFPTIFSRRAFRRSSRSRLPFLFFLVVITVVIQKHAYKPGTRARLLLSSQFELQATDTTGIDQPSFRAQPSNTAHDCGAFCLISSHSTGIRRNFDDSAHCVTAFLLDPVSEREQQTRCKSIARRRRVDKP